MRKQSRLIYIILFLIILIAFILRVYRLGTSASFTGDEVTTVSHSMQKLVDIPKLENLLPLEALWIKFGAQALGMGYSEFSVFLLSVIVSLVGVFVVYKLGKLLFDDYVGLLSAFLLAFSVYDIYWSRSASYYALMVFLSSAAFLCLYWALNSNQKRAGLFYAFFRILSLYDHLTALWMFFGEGIFALGYTIFPILRNVWKRRYEVRLGQKKNLWSINRKSFRNITTNRFFWFAISFSLVLIAYSPVLYPDLRDLITGNSVFRIGALSSEQIAPREVRTGQLQSLLGGGWRGALLVFEQLTGWIQPLNIILLILFISGILFCIQKRQWTQLLFNLTILITPFVLSKFIRSYSLVLDGRYLISILPLYYILASRGISGLANSIGNIIGTRRNINLYTQMGIFVMFGIAISGLNLTKIPLTFRITGQNWRAVSQFLAQNAKPGEMIVVDGRSTNFRGLQFYLPGFNVVQNDPRVSYDTLYKNKEDFWLVFEPGTSLYNGLRYWSDEVGAISIIFSSGWYPDIDQNSDLAPAQSWDLYVVHVSQTKVPIEQALELHKSWLAVVEADNPSNVRWHLTMAEAYQRFDDCSNAINEYNKAINEGYVNEQLASYIYGARGICWSRLGGKEELAIADWQRAISRASWSREPYQRLYSYYILLGRTDEAQRLCQAARIANPQKAWPLVLQGDYYRMNGQTEQAINEYKQAIALEPAEQTSYQHLSETYMGAGEYDQVISLYQDTIQHNPWLGWTHLQLGQFFNSMGKVTEALFQYQKAVALQPELGPAVSKFLQNTHWDLASNLNIIHAYTDHGNMLQWQDNAWTRSNQSEAQVLIGHSTQTVDGQVQPDQILFHPSGNEEDTSIEFAIPQNYFTQLNVSYGMADEIADKSNGVRYLIEVRRLGEETYKPLLDLSVEKNNWQEQTVSLLPYWGEDLEFRLIVNARGDYSYDWLQTTVDLLPPSQPVWDLSDNLEKAQFTLSEQSILKGESGYIAPDGSLLIGPSVQPVEGQNLSEQVIFHPYSSETNSTLTFFLHNYGYKYLKTWFSLADGALPNSNGVEYTVSASTDGGLSFVNLVQSTVTDNIWRSTLIELPEAQDLVLRLSSSALGNIDSDWLQVRLDLLPVDNRDGALTTK